MKRKFNTDLDAEYKLPKIVKNYKGNEVKTFSIPEFSMVIVPGETSPTRRQSTSRRSEAAAALTPSSNRNSQEDVGKGAAVSVDHSTASGAAAPPSPLVSRPSLTPFNRRPSITSYFTVSPEWNQQWGRFLPPGKNVVYTSQIGKI